MENREYMEASGEGFSLCAWVQERLPEMVEGYLEALTAEAIRAHLAVCYLCAKEYSEMERTIKLVETLPFAEPHKDVTSTIMATIAEMESQSDHSFPSPVVEVETEVALKRLVPFLTLVSVPQSATGCPRQGSPANDQESFAVQLGRGNSPLPCFLAA